MTSDAQVALHAAALINQPTSSQYDQARGPVDKVARDATVLLRWLREHSYAGDDADVPDDDVTRTYQQ